MNKYFYNNSYLKNIAGLIVIAIFFIGDRILKAFALNIEQGQIFSLIKNWLNFHYVPNPYIAFSLPLSGSFLIIIITSLILLLLFYIIYLILNKKKSKAIILPLIFILFGAMSNLLDRFLYGFVIDYFDLRYFTAFNIADVMITLGVIFVLYKQLKS
jgi:signal peptidase II